MLRTLVPLILFSSAMHLPAEWQPLFNGKDLTGWSGDPRLWRVEDGVLIGETNNSDKKIAANSFLIWQGGEPADFELEYKARVVGNNSGVQYRSKVVDAAKWSVGGYQMDLHPNAPYLGMLYEERGRGIACQRGQKVNLGDKPEETGKLEVPAVDLATWNTFRIVAKGNLLQHFVNDKLAAEINDVHPDKRSAKGVIASAGPRRTANEDRVQGHADPDDESCTREGCTTHEGQEGKAGKAGGTAPTAVDLERPGCRCQREGFFLARNQGSRGHYLRFDHCELRQPPPLVCEWQGHRHGRRMVAPTDLRDS